MKRACEICEVEELCDSWSVGEEGKTLYIFEKEMKKYLMDKLFDYCKTNDGKCIEDLTFLGCKFDAKSEERLCDIAACEENHIRNIWVRPCFFSCETFLKLAHCLKSKQGHLSSLDVAADFDNVQLTKEEWDVLLSTQLFANVPHQKFGKEFYEALGENSSCLYWMIQVGDENQHKVMGALAKNYTVEKLNVYLDNPENLESVFWGMMAAQAAGHCNVWKLNIMPAHWLREDSIAWAIFRAGCEDIINTFIKDIYSLIEIEFTSL